MSDEDKLATVSAEVVTEPTEPAETMPKCVKCGGELCFASAGAGDVQWWRCTGCSQHYPARSARCSHSPTRDTRCAVCGGSGGAVTTTVRGPRGEVTMHFCSVAHMREAFQGE